MNGETLGAPRVRFAECSVSDGMDQDWDLLLCASGYEQRARHVVTTLNIPALRKVALAFAEHSENAERRRNDSALTKMGCTLLQSPGDQGEAVRALLREVALVAKQGELRIVLDISSMTRVWLWAALAECATIGLRRDVRVLVLYSKAEFVEPLRSYGPASFVGPVLGTPRTLRSAALPVALVVGAGYELNRALGVVEYIDAEEAWLFHTRVAADNAYSRSVSDANEALRARVGSERVCEYELDDWVGTLNVLDALVAGLVRRARVVCVPMGPKPFAFLNCVLALARPEVSLWRVSTGAFAAVQERVPNGRVLSAIVKFELAHVEVEVATTSQASVFAT